ncbi:MAG: fumarylacetoacetate hydrolase family protein [Pseudomonadota bacterium]
MITHEVTQAMVPMEDGRQFPVRRIFCIGKNYADHVVEMGDDPRKVPPVFFTKPADAACTDQIIPFPPATENLHYEGELVVALGAGGTDLSERDARAAIFGYACGCDLTRRDLQAAAKDAGAPWDLAKALDNGAMLGLIRPHTGLLREGSLTLSVNGTERQSANLNAMIWSVPEIIAKLSGFFALKPGDLIFTGTPSGVGPLQRGDYVAVEIADLPPLRFSLAP